MKYLSKLLLLCATLSFVATETNASDTIAIIPTNKASLLDDHGSNEDEWQTARKSKLPAQS